MPGAQLADYFLNISNRNENSTIQLSDNSIRYLNCPILFVIGTLFVAFGMAGNFITGIVILTRKTLHSPTFTAIMCLALSDFLSTLSRYFLISNGRQNATHEQTIRILETVALLFLHSANFHMVLISYVRYIFVARPMVSMQITCRKILKISCFIWLFSITFSAIYAIS
jgi:hypothetical protein